MIVEYKVKLFQELPGDHSQAMRDKLRTLGTNINVNEVRKLNYKDTMQRHQDFVNKIFDLTKELNVGYVTEMEARSVGEALVPIIYACYEDMTYPIMRVGLTIEQSDHTKLYYPSYEIKMDTSD